MTTSFDREVRLIEAVRELRDFYRAQNKPDFVTMYQEDFDWMKKRGKIVETQSGHYLDSMRVVRGYRKRKPRKRRPKEVLV